MPKNARSVIIQLNFDKNTDIYENKETRTEKGIF